MFDEKARLLSVLTLDKKIFLQNNYYPSKYAHCWKHVYWVLSYQMRVKVEDQLISSHIECTDFIPQAMLFT